jgi:hypothetical protein
MGNITAHWPRSPLYWHCKDTMHLFGVKSIVSVDLLLWRKANYYFLESADYPNRYWLTSKINETPYTENNNKEYNVL